MRPPALALLLLLLACRPKTLPQPPPVEVAAPVEPTRPASEPAPIPPFTATQIREEMQPGTHLRFRLTAMGQSPVVMDWKVVAADAEQVTIAYTSEAEDGSIIAGPFERSNTWAELESHGHFPPKDTTWKDGPVTVAAGTIENGRCYEVRLEERGLPVQSTFCFDLDHPGAPALMVVRREGVESERMELLLRE